MVLSYSVNKMKLLLSIGFVLAIFSQLTIAHRELTAEYNPGCTNKDRCSSSSKLAYVRAKGDNDTVHYIFDFSSSRKPSLILLTTANDAVIQINYNETDVENTIKFSKTPSYTFASVFNKLYEFNDINDTANIEHGEQLLTMDLKMYDWNMTQLINHNNESVEITVSSVNIFRAPGFSKHGTVSITLRVHGKNGIGSILPHLVHTPESGELTLTLDKLHTSYANSRFAVELLTFSSLPFIKSEELLFDKFSDDKSAGGTFYNYYVEAKDDKETGGYLSWKPVVYKAPNTHPLNSSSTFQYGIQDHRSENDWIKSPLYKLYGNNLFNTSLYLKKAINVSFGEPADEFYVKSNYLYWTFLVGVGAPTNSNLNGFLELSIIASLLLMLTITMILIFCIFMRWVSSKRNSIIYGQ